MIALLYYWHQNDLDMKRKPKWILVVVVVAAAAAAAIEVGGSCSEAVVVKGLHHTNGLSKPSFSNFMQLKIQGTH